jgi:hypothetical protein
MAAVLVDAALVANVPYAQGGVEASGGEELAIGMEVNAHTVRVVPGKCTHHFGLFEIP